VLLQNLRLFEIPIYFMVIYWCSVIVHLQYPLSRPL
jgi:hypothetical protein